MEYFSVSEVSKMLKISKYTIREWMRDGKIKGTKLSDKVWRVSGEELENFIKEGVTRANSCSDVQKS